MNRFTAKKSINFLIISLENYSHLKLFPGLVSQVQLVMLCVKVDRAADHFNTLCCVGGDV